MNISTLLLAQGKALPAHINLYNVGVVLDKLLLAYSPVLDKMP